MLPRRTHRPRGPCPITGDKRGLPPPPGRPAPNGCPTPMGAGFWGAMAARADGRRSGEWPFGGRPRRRCRWANRSRPPLPFPSSPDLRQKPAASQALDDQLPGTQRAGESFLCLAKKPGPIVQPPPALAILTLGRAPAAAEGGSAFCLTISIRPTGRCLASQARSHDAGFAARAISDSVSRRGLTAGIRQPFSPISSPRAPASARIRFCSFSKARTSIWRMRSRLTP